MVAVNEPSALGQDELVRAKAAFQRLQVPYSNEIRKEALPEVLQYLGYSMDSDREVLMHEVAEEVTGFSCFDFDELCIFLARHASAEWKRLRNLFEARASAVGEGGSTLTVEALRRFLCDLGVHVARSVLREELGAAGSRCGAGGVRFRDLERLLRARRDSQGFSRAETGRLQRVFDRFAVDGCSAGAGATLPAASLCDALVHMYGPQVKDATERIEEELLGRGEREGVWMGPPCASVSRSRLLFEEFLMCARRLQEAQLGAYQDEFRRCDRDNSGFISMDELHGALRDLGYEAPRDEMIAEVLEEVLEECCSVAGATGCQQQQLDFDEFAGFMLIFRQRRGFLKVEIDEFREVFRRCDADRSGEICVLEMNDVLQSEGYTRRDLDELSHLINQVDVDGSNALDFQELLQLMRLFRDRQRIRIREVFERHGDATHLAAEELAPALEAIGYEVMQVRAWLSASSAEAAEKGVSIDAFMSLMDQCRRAPGGRWRRSAGFTEADLQRFWKAFEACDEDKSGDISAWELEALLEEVGYAPTTHEVRSHLGEMLDAARVAAREAGVESTSESGSGCVRFWELVQFLRTMRKRQEREVEDTIKAVARETNFSQQEVRQFREIFVGWKNHASVAQADAGGLSLGDVRRLLHTLGVPTTQKQREALEKQVKELATAASKKADVVQASSPQAEASVEPRIGFTGFLYLMRWLMDCDFGGINRVVAAKHGEDRDTTATEAAEAAPTEHGAPVQAAEHPLKLEMQAVPERNAKNLSPATPSTRTPSPAPSSTSSQGSPTSPAPSPALTAGLWRTSASRTLGFDVAGDIVEQAFGAFCDPQQGMDCKSFVRLCKECRLIDEQRCKAVDMELIFARVAQRGSAFGSHRRLNLQHFETALGLVAEKKRVEALVVLETLAQAQVMQAAVSGTTPVDFRTQSLPATGLELPSQPRPQTSAASGPQAPSQTILSSLSSAIASLPEDPSLRQATLMSGPASRALLRSRSASRVLDSGARANASSDANLSNLKTALRAHRFVSELAAKADSVPTMPVTHRVPAKAVALPALQCQAGSQRSQADWMGQAFARFCSSKQGMDARDFERLCHHCLLENRKFTVGDVSNVFSEVVPRGHFHIDREAFEKALRLIATRKDVAEDSVLRAVRLCAGQAPVARGRQDARASLSTRAPLLA